MITETRDFVVSARGDLGRLEGIAYLALFMSIDCLLIYFTLGKP
jgi:hypothetical protein